MRNFIARGLVIVGGAPPGVAEATRDAAVRTRGFRPLFDSRTNDTSDWSRR